MQRFILINNEEIQANELNITAENASDLIQSENQKEKKVDPKAKRKRLTPEDFIKKNKMASFKVNETFIPIFQSEAKDYKQAIGIIDFIIFTVTESKQGKPIKSKSIALATLDKQISDAVRQVACGETLGGELIKRMEQYTQLRMLIETASFDELNRSDEIAKIDLGNRTELKNYIENLKKSTGKNKLVANLLVVRDQLKAVRKKLLQTADNLNSFFIKSLEPLEKSIAEKRKNGHAIIHAELKGANVKIYKEKLKALKIERQMKEDDIIDLSTDEREKLTKAAESEAQKQLEEKITAFEEVELVKIAKNLSIFNKMILTQLIESDVMGKASVLNANSGHRTPFLEICKVFPQECFPPKEMTRQKKEKEVQFKNEFADHPQKIEAAEILENESKHEKKKIKRSQTNLRRVKTRKKTSSSKANANTRSKTKSEMNRTRQNFTPPIVPHLVMPKPLAESSNNNEMIYASQTAKAYGESNFDYLPEIHGENTSDENLIPGIPQLIAQGIISPLEINPNEVSFSESKNEKSNASETTEENLIMGIPMLREKGIIPEETAEEIELARQLLKERMFLEKSLGEENILNAEPKLTTKILTAKSQDTSVVSEDILEKNKLKQTFSDGIKLERKHGRRSLNPKNEKNPISVKPKKVLSAKSQESTLSSSSDEKNKVKLKAVKSFNDYRPAKSSKKSPHQLKKKTAQFNPLSLTTPIPLQDSDDLKNDSYLFKTNPTHHNDQKGTDQEKQPSSKFKIRIKSLKFPLPQTQKDTKDEHELPSSKDSHKSSSSRRRNSKSSSNKSTERSGRSMSLLSDEQIKAAVKEASPKLNQSSGSRTKMKLTRTTARRFRPNNFISTSGSDLENPTHRTREHGVASSQPTFTEFQPILESQEIAHSDPVINTKRKSLNKEKTGKKLIRIKTTFSLKTHSNHLFFKPAKTEATPAAVVEEVNVADANVSKEQKSKKKKS